MGNCTRNTGRRGWGHNVAYAKRYQIEVAELEQWIWNLLILLGEKIVVMEWECSGNGSERIPLRVMRGRARSGSPETKK